MASSSSTAHESRTLAAVPGNLCGSILAGADGHFGVMCGSSHCGSNLVRPLDHLALDHLALDHLPRTLAAVSGILRGSSLALEHLAGAR